jgi:hypothetical protein
MKVKISSEPVDFLNYESLVLGFFSDERPPRGYCGFVDWRFNGMISKQIADGKVTGSFMEKTLINSNSRIPSLKILLLGLGKSTNLTYDQLYTAGHVITQTTEKINCTDYAFDIPSPERCNLQMAEMTTAMISGFTDEAIKNKTQSDDIMSASILGKDIYRDEIVLGANQFKVNVKNKIKVIILEI